jgi:dual specificity phosphatase 12
MGKSRSAAVCIAFLLHREPGAMTPSEALEMIRRSRPLCEPNDGFMEQLHLYHKMGCPKNVTAHPLYQRWLYQRAVEESVACGRAPELDLVRFEDEHPETSKTNDEATEIRCRKCRFVLHSPIGIWHLVSVLYETDSLLSF